VKLLRGRSDPEADTEANYFSCLRFRNWFWEGLIIHRRSLFNVRVVSFGLDYETIHGETRYGE